LRDDREHERNIRVLVGQGDAANTNETSGGSSVTATLANTRRRIVNAKFRGGSYDLRRRFSSG
jgi:hypothetical protein